MEYPVTVFSRRWCKKVSVEPRHCSTTSQRAQCQKYSIQKVKCDTCGLRNGLQCNRERYKSDGSGSRLLCQKPDQGLCIQSRFFLQACIFILSGAFTDSRLACRMSVFLFAEILEVEVLPTATSSFATETLFFNRMHLFYQKPCNN